MTAEQHQAFINASAISATQLNVLAKLLFIFFATCWAVWIVIGIVKQLQQMEQDVADIVPRLFRVAIILSICIMLVS